VRRKKNGLPARQKGLTAVLGWSCGAARMGDSPELEWLQLPISSYGRAFSPGYRIKCCSKADMSRGDAKTRYARLQDCLRVLNLASARVRRRRGVWCSVKSIIDGPRPVLQ
jgi:hypothetical protein